MMNRSRSLLFVSADDHARLDRIATRGADAVILDLEDAVPADRKAAAATLRVERACPVVMPRSCSNQCAMA
jgi:citrate lyase beta subunit